MTLISAPTDLELRVLACPHYREMPGMRFLVGKNRAPYRCVSADYMPPEGDDVACTDPVVPDLTDPGTLGCLLALVREAWGNPKICVAYRPDICCWLADNDCGGYGDSEAETLVNALAAAPLRTLQTSKGEQTP